MSLLLRSTPLRAARALPLARQQAQARFVHIENVVDHTLPTSVKNKYWLAVKMALYTTAGFGAPFFAAWFQLSKAAGA
ncbi:hypothetical protein EHS25_010122 [Saitozyma podzolica]|uniref:Cytochrome c oxidase subunit 8, mitochondrial n=1 Tax=Saitozyma podzolica TaxID=1890683 RepID=A0A427YIM8_9TREE|nr:hypothetical protein EHS25_010122 [Saitozyma podzolica]